MGMGAGRLTGGAPYPVDGTRSPAGVDRAGSGLRHTTPPRALSGGTMPASDIRRNQRGERERERAGGLAHRRPAPGARLPASPRSPPPAALPLRDGHGVTRSRWKSPPNGRSAQPQRSIGMCAHLRVARRSPLAPLRRAVLGLLLGWAELTSGDPCRTTLCALHEKE